MLEGVTEAVGSAHELWRFVVLIGGGVALGRMAVGWIGNRVWESTDQNVVMFFIAAFDLEVALGLLLWLLQGMRMLTPLIGRFLVCLLFNHIFILDLFVLFPEPFLAVSIDSLS